MYSLEVTVKSAVNLQNVEISGKSDPYVIVEFQGMSKETKVIEDELNPVWNEVLTIDLKGKPLLAADKMLVTVKDHDKVTPDKFMGSAEIPLREVVTGKGEMNLKIYLKNKKGQETMSTLELSVRYITPKKAADSSGGTVIVQGEDASQVVDNLGQETVEQYDTDAGIVMPSDVTAAAGGGGQVLSRKVREPYSTKPQDFQIRVKIIEARQLQGSNIPPVCKVNCAGKSKETKIRAPTNSPYWNETFFFNFHEAPSKLLDQSISFGVYHSRKLRKDALIGSFKFDLALAYEQDKHALLNKWLLLCDPEGPMSGAKGYLKVSVVILGPGDEAPSMKVDSDNEDDIEANLLRPAGVQLRPAMFTLRIYNAEDLPRMDPDTFKGIRNLMSKDEEKQFVDPYVEVNFAGKKLKTSTKYCTDHPEWNEEMVLNFQFPSMCEKIRITAYDWDRVGNNDPIGTGTIWLPLISAYRDDSDGFLPVFGPSYINLYGSPREFTDMPNKYDAMNSGKLEGASYRGRILVELRTELLDEPTTDEIRSIDADTVARIQKCLRRRKYRLFGTFISATQIPGEKSSPIEFEVSVGNHGNKLDDSVPPCVSTTPPTNPIYDGSFYSYLPWGDNKPCTVVDSQWEDISYRLFAKNMLNRIAQNLDVNVQKIKMGLSASATEEHLAQLAIATLDEFILDCGQDLPEWDPENNPPNEMDFRLRELRDSQLSYLRETAVEARESLKTIDEAVILFNGLSETMKNLAKEPQESFPDVVIWMLSGGKRKAYYRIPPDKVIYSTNPVFIGAFCGIPQIVNFKKLTAKDESEEQCIRPAVQVRAIFWLGLEKDQAAWNESLVESTTHVVAETYENQASIVGKWVTKRPPLTRPAWSDSTGKIELKKENFYPPEGWQWDGDWFLDPEMSVTYQNDTGKTVYIEEVYYNEARTPTTSWAPATPEYTDSQGEPHEPLDQVELPEGWSWVGDWEVDLKRVCDEEGFEYAVTASEDSYVATEKLHHMFRRKRMVRKRILGDAGLAVKQEVVGSILGQKREERLSLLDRMQAEPAEMWEYAFNFDSKFHLKERTIDAVRRRRWHRRMVPVGLGSTNYVMTLGTDGSPLDEGKIRKKKENLTVPRVYIQYERSHEWQLRTYIFQARDLLSADQSGMSDPYAYVAFQGLCERTETLQGTICPTWDQTIIFDRVLLYGAPQRILDYPPVVTVDIFDWDKVGSDNYLGRCEVVPFIKLSPDAQWNAVLNWYDIKKGTRAGGELLASFELILLDGKEPPLPPPRRGDLYRVPDNIRPKLARTGIEIVCWGVRNMAKHQLASVNSPSVEFEIGGKVCQSSTIKSVRESPNFSNPILFMDVMLPVEDLYIPPMNIIVRDHRAFGQTPRVGIHVLSTLANFRYPVRTTEHDPILQIPALTERGIIPEVQPVAMAALLPDEKKETPKKKFLDMERVDDEVDWWSKLYASLGEWNKCIKYRELGYDTLTVYNYPLEKAEEFSGFQDFCTTFELTKGKNVDEDEDNFAGEFKGTFRIYRLPDDPKAPMPLKYFDKLSVSPDPEECLVRVYVIRALELQPSDPSGLADPYVELKLGSKTVSSKDAYIPNTLNPEFGRVFELRCRLPMEKDLRIRVKDYDAVGVDDVIGETSIDLENRRLTKHRATCGIPRSYYVSGPSQWRDSKIPSALLAQLCDEFNIPPPQYEEPTDTHPYPTCRLGMKQLSLEDFERDIVISPHHGPPKERLALHLLNLFPIVKEHVETRPIFNNLQPDIEQGRLQLWVDIFPVVNGSPGPIVDISPRLPQEYILRVVVWNVYEVYLEETSITGEKMSDIYVMGWLSGIDERQKTDVHYRSLDGEGNFNWRFVFPFQYVPAENMLVVRKKEKFWSLDATETRVRPTLLMQVWDNDLFNPDDFLGTLELNLAQMPSPAKNRKSCTLKIVQSVDKNTKMINLFDSRRTKGFWPFKNDEGGTQVLRGKIEMELEILTKAEEALKPAGRAREEPNANPKLNPPKRPETSFLWITSPWKTFKFIIWKKCKWVFIGILIALLLGLLLFLFIYAIPQLLARKMINV